MPEKRFACPCCGNYTLDAEPPGTFDICEVCFWEDDPVQFANPDFIGGANPISLTQAKKNYATIGACDRAFIASVRPPTPDELPSANE